MLELTLHAKQEINKIMTTKELLDSVTFKGIAPYLSRYLGNAPTISMLLKELCIVIVRHLTVCQSQSLYKLKFWMLDDSNKMFNFELVSVG